MTHRIHHIAPNGHGGWCIRRDGEEAPLLQTDTKIKAINIGMEISRKQDATMVIHEQGHRISRCLSPSADSPEPVRTTASPVADAWPAFLAKKEAIR
jgi:hypothetical protein